MAGPSYLELYERGELEERAEKLAGLSSSCTLCPHRCGVDRTSGKLGICDSPLEARVSSAFAHFGEEAPLVGRMGSGTIFFCGCNLRCKFCQNWEISQGPDTGHALSREQLASLMIDLQRQGCHNINFVTPTHYIHAIVSALATAAARGLSVPLVYNCGGYESLETLACLDGIFDIYMPDAKFYDDEIAGRFLSAGDYGTRSRQALLAMHSQVGELETGPAGIAVRGMLIRHLVMPGGLAGTAQWATWIAGELSPDSYVNIMDQYRPCHSAKEDIQIGRRPTSGEFHAAVEQARAAGLNGRGFLSPL